MTDIDQQVKEFEAAGGVIEKIPSREELKEIQRKKKELAQQEKQMKAYLDQNKSERSEARDAIREAKESFEKTRSALGKNMTQLNNIHLSKSAIKHYDEFLTVSTTFLLSLAETEKTLNSYLKVLKEGKEIGL